MKDQDQAGRTKRKWTCFRTVWRLDKSELLATGKESMIELIAVT